MDMNREYTDNFLIAAAAAYFDEEESDNVMELVNEFINTPSPDYTIDFLRKMDVLLDDIYIAIDNYDYCLEEYDSHMKMLDDARDWIHYYRRQIFRKKYHPKRQFNVDYCMKKYGCTVCTATDEVCRILHPIST